MESRLAGINEDKIDRLILDIYDYADKVNSIFNRIDELVDSTKDFYNCESAELFRNKFLEFKQNFKVVNENILGYAGEITSAKNNYKKRESEMVMQVNRYKTAVEEKSV